MESLDKVKRNKEIDGRHIEIIRKRKSSVINRIADKIMSIITDAKRIADKIISIITDAKRIDNQEYSSDDNKRQNREV